MEKNLNWHKSTCPYCGMGCHLMVGIKQGKIIKIHGMENSPISRGYLCTIAANLAPVFTAKDRQTKPMIRRDGELVAVTWDEAIAQVAGKLGHIIDKHGADSVAFYGGAANLSEEYYLVNKLMKGFIGTNNLECSSRLCMASTAMGFVSTLGIDAPPTCYADIEKADLFFIAGNNMAVSVPVLFRRLHTAKNKNGVKVIVVDPRRTKTAAIADIHLQIRPATDIALNNALAHVLLKQGLVNEKKVEYFASGLDKLKELLEDYSPARAAEITGCPEEQIIAAARMIGSSKAMLTFWLTGYNHSTQAIFKNNSLHNLSLLTGNYLRPGAGPISITGEANTTGNRWIGALSHLLPGVRQVANFEHRQEVAKLWGIPEDRIKPVPGRSILDIIKGLHSGEIRALWVMATNPLVSLPHTHWVKKALAKAELLIVQDIYRHTETVNMAEIVLAAAQWCEKTGTFISSERRVELVEKLIEPPGEAKPDYEIICLIARAMGFENDFAYSSPEEVFEEWKKFTLGRICDMGGISYARLRGKIEIGLQLPCPDAEHPGTERLFTDGKFPRADGRAALLARHQPELQEKADPEYPFILTSGRLANHFNTRTRTGRVPLLNDVEPDIFIDINPEDASRLGINNGDKVTVSSRRGVIQVPTRISDTILPGVVFMPMHYNETLDGKINSVNCLTNPIYDRHSKQPEFKYCAVRISL